MEDSKKKELEFDNKYSRLIGAMDKDALERFQKSSVLISGCKGLGLEIAKNIALMGVKSLTLHDTEPVKLRDLSSNFYASEADAEQGINRAAAVRPKIQELNDRCDLKVHEQPLTEDFVSKFKIVVLTDIKSREEVVKLSDACHKANVPVIVADTWGVFGYSFVDFGQGHVINDRTGERPKTGYLSSVTRHDKSGLCMSLERHDLEDGMYVKISEVEGIPSINGNEFKVTTNGPYVFSIGDISGHEGEYRKGGMFEEVKKPEEVSFEPLSAQLAKPLDIWTNFIATDFAKQMDAPSLMLLLLGVWEFRQKHKGAFPQSAEDTEELLKIVRALNKDVPHVEDQINEQLISSLAAVSRGDLNPMAAFFGGILAQEVIKAASGKYMPIKQWCFFDSREILPEKVDLADTAERGTRYDGQVAVLGNVFQEKLMNLRYFLVGTGAIGCEILKNWACMGMGTGPRGSLVLTDNDIIEISNLNRQFLYRAWDVSHPKSETSAKAAIAMNSAMKIKPYITKVCPDTEDIFNDEFWTSLDGVCNALDNIHARLYVDGKCAFFGKSLLESGTLGTKGNTQVMVPHVTQTYGESSDPEPKETAKCLLHSFPSNIEHCLQWARELLFEGEFVLNPEEVNSYFKNKNYIAQLTDMERKKKLDILAGVLVERQKTVDDCIVWARMLFEEYYVRRPKQLLHTFPLDAKDGVGQPFWQGTRRPPKPTPFDPTNETHLDFVIASARLRAYTLGLVASEFKPEQGVDRAHYARVAGAYAVPEWKPKDGIKIAFDPEKEKEQQEEANQTSHEDQEIEALVKSLPSSDSLAGWKLNSLDFEKDDDRNYHIDFVHAASNLRAVAYEIPTVPRLQAKLIAGKIIPAIVTTTACVAGLVCLELYKLIQGKTKIDLYRNAFINLALPLFQITEPMPPNSYQFKGKKYTTWDSIKINEGDITVQQLIDHLKAKFGLNVYTLTMPAKGGEKNMFMSFGDWTRELSMKVSDLARELLAKEKMQLQPLQRCVQLKVTFDDGDDADPMDVGPENAEEDQFPPIWFYFK